MFLWVCAWTSPWFCGACTALLNPDVLEFQSMWFCTRPRPHLILTTNTWAKAAKPGAANSVAGNHVLLMVCAKCFVCEAPRCHYIWSVMHSYVDICEHLKQACVCQWCAWIVHAYMHTWVQTCQHICIIVIMPTCIRTMPTFLYKHKLNHAHTYMLKISAIMPSCACTQLRSNTYACSCLHAHVCIVFCFVTFQNAH